MKRFKILGLISLVIMIFAISSCSKDEIEDPNKGQTSVETVDQEQIEQTAIVIVASNSHAMVETIEQSGSKYIITFSNGNKAEISLKSSGSENAVYVKSIVITDEEVTFTLTNSQILILPQLYAMSVDFDGQDLAIIGSNEIRDIHYTIISNVDNITVETKPTEGIEVETVEGESAKEGIIRIKTGNIVPDNSEVVIFISNPGRTISKKIAIEAAGLVIYDNSTKEIEAEGGTLKLEYLSNIECVVKIPEEYADWIRESENTRSLEYGFRAVDILPNYGDERIGKVIIEGLNNNLSIEYTIIQKISDDALASKQREALIALYKATDGDNWKVNTNWCSDKPVYEWYGINYNYWANEVVESNLVVSLFLEGNNLIGQIPEEFSCLLDYMNTTEGRVKNQFSFSINGNGLYGKIPQSVLDHPRWGELGWGIVDQNPWYGKRLEIEDYNLKMPEREIQEYKNKQFSNITLDDVFARNSYTLVYFISGAEDGCLTTVDFTKAKVNLHLDFHNKGLNTVFSIMGPNKSISDWFDLSVPEDAPQDIIYINDYDPYYRSTGIIKIFDKDGYLVYTLEKDFAINEDWYISETKNKLIELLGQPEEHQEFEMDDFYTSTDFSLDGTYYMLQKATEGKGIDLIFMGDAYVDKDMNEGGKYDQDMKEGMEKLFSIEPYNSLRNYFNVYCIRVVSPNNLFLLDGSETKINWNDEVCFNYALKIPEINKERIMISVIFGSKGFFRDQTSMYTDGSFISYMSKGITDALIHEIGGHGIAKLYDEYVEEGYEMASITQESKDYLDNIWSELGWGANVDWRNDIERVKWSHFLKDARYSNENLGIFEGSYLFGLGAYRPTENSMMRHNDLYFNAPSREQIYKTVMTLSNGSGWKYDYEDFVSFDMNNSSRSYNTRAYSQRNFTINLENDHSKPIIKRGNWRNATSSLKYRKEISK